MRIQWVNNYFKLYLIVLITTVPSAIALSDESLLNLLEKVQRNKTSEASWNTDRERRFRSEAAARREMMRKAEAQVSEQENLRDRLKSQFDKNEEELAELEALLEKRVGDLGELFGVFRQMADDSQTMLYDSLITFEKPERKKIVSALAESDEIPTIPQMRELWTLMIEEAALSGQVSRFQSEITEPGGENYVADVVRVGTFNIITGNRYLNYLSETDQAIELPRQPAGYVQ